MRTSHTCPKCRHQRLYVVDKVQFADTESVNAVYTTHVTAVRIPSKEIGGKSKYRTKVGVLQAWICASCGYTEYYSSAPKNRLELLSRIPGSGIRVVTAQDKAPFR